MVARLLRAFVLVIALLSVALANAQAKIKPGDVLRLICMEEASMNKDYRVTTDGLVLVDFLGAVKVVGLSEKEASDKIAKQLVDERILRKATVSIEIVKTEVRMIKFGGAVKLQAETPWRQGIRLADIVTLADASAETDLTKVTIKSISGKIQLVDFTKKDDKTKDNNPLLQPGDEVTFVAKAKGQPVDPKPVDPKPTDPKPVDPPVQKVKISVSGAVVLPGEFEFAAGMTVRDAILRAGGFSDRADSASITLERGATKREIKMPGDAQVALMEGDKLSVPEKVAPKMVVTVGGAVTRPGRVEISEGMTLTDALKAAGWFTKGAKPNRIVILTPGNAKPREVNYEDIELGYTGDIVLRPGQYIEVPGAKAPLVTRQNARLAGALAAILLIFGA